MPIYTGKTYRQFLVDRYAMGFEPVAIMQEFERVMGVPITEAEIERILAGAGDDIRRRESELCAELKSTNVISALLSIKDELAEVAQLARQDKDYKTFAQLANSSMKSLEVLISMTEKFRNRETTKGQLNIQNNVMIIQLLEKDGALKIVDENKLRELLHANPPDVGE